MRVFNQSTTIKVFLSFIAIIFASKCIAADNICIIPRNCVFIMVQIEDILPESEEQESEDEDERYVLHYTSNPIFSALVDIKDVETIELDFQSIHGYIESLYANKNVYYVPNFADIPLGSTPSLFSYLYPNVPYEKNNSVFTSLIYFFNDLKWGDQIKLKYEDNQQLIIRVFEFKALCWDTTLEDLEEKGINLTTNNDIDFHKYGISQVCIPLHIFSGSLIRTKYISPDILKIFDNQSNQLEIK